MSTVAKIRMLVRFNLRDTDVRNESFDTPEIDRKIISKYLMHGALLPPAHEAIASHFTIASGASTFTFTMGKATGSATFSDISDLSIQLVSNNKYLRKIDRDQIDSYRNREPSPYLAEPERFAIYEDLDGVVRGICHPAANAAYACNVFMSNGQEVPFSATNLDSAAVIFTDPCQEALAALVSADFLPMIPDDELTKRRINPRGVDTMVRSWNKVADRVLHREAIRRNNVQASAEGIQRWVS